MKIFQANVWLYFVTLGLFLTQSLEAISRPSLEEKLDLKLQVTCLPEKIVTVPSHFNFFVQMGTGLIQPQGKMIDNSGSIIQQDSSQHIIIENRPQVLFVFPGFEISLTNFCVPPYLEEKEKHELKGKYLRTSNFSSMAILSPLLGECKLSTREFTKFHEGHTEKHGEGKHKVRFGKNTHFPYQIKFVRDISISAPQEDQQAIEIRVD